MICVEYWDHHTVVTYEVFLWQADIENDDRKLAIKEYEVQSKKSVEVSVRMPYALSMHMLMPKFHAG
jgi:hypothetical protein